MDDSLLQHLWNDTKLPASEIGKLLKAPRNSVLSRVLKLRKKGITMHARAPAGARRTFNVGPKLSVNLMPAITAVESLAYGMCRWPIGKTEDPGFHFCGCVTEGSTSYCPPHHEMAYLK